MGFLRIFRKDWADLRDDQVDMVRRMTFFFMMAGKASWPSSSRAASPASARTPRQSEKDRIWEAIVAASGVMSRMFFQARPDLVDRHLLFQPRHVGWSLAGQGFPWPYHRKLFRRHGAYGWDHEPAS